MRGFVDATMQFLCGALFAVGTVLVLALGVYFGFVLVLERQLEQVERSCAPTTEERIGEWRA